MRFTIDAEHLKKVMGLLAPLVPGRVVIPTIAHVLIETVGDDALRFTVNNLDMGLCLIHRSARIDVQGATTVDAARLKAIADNAPVGSEISLEVKDAGSASVVACRARFRLSTLNVDTFPALIEAKDMITLDLATGDLKTLMAVGWAASTEQHRIYLNGVYLTYVNDKVVAVATDGHRLMRLTRPVCVGGGEPKGLGHIVPNETVKALVGVCGDRAGTLRFSERALELEVDLGDLGEATFRSKLIDGTYPDYERVIPQERDNGKMLSVKSDDLRRALKSCSIGFIGSKSKTSAVRLTLEGDALQIEVKGDTQETAVDDINVVYAGENLTWGCNYKYMLGAVDALGVANLKVLPEQDGNPLRMEPDPADGRVIVVMGMRV